MTLIELLTVIVIISILAGLLLAVVNAARRRVYETRAKAETRELMRAWNAYWLTYRKWPPSLQFQSAAEMNAANIAYLMTNNSQGIMFLDPSINVKAQGFKDPWGNYYRVRFRQTNSPSEDIYEATVFFPLVKRYHYDNL